MAASSEKYGPETQKTFYCPQCKSPMRRIDGKMGPFWGCTDFPNCRKTLNDLDGEPSEEVDEHYRCPLCTRQLVKAENEKGKYWYCCGYNKGCKVTLDDDNGRPEAAYRCRNCSQLLVKRQGKNGEFWGCSQYPKCISTYPDHNGGPDYSQNKKTQQE